MTVDFSISAGNTRKLQQRLDRNATGEISLNCEHSLAGRDCHFSMWYQDQTANWKELQQQKREFGPTELYSESTCNIKEHCTRTVFMSSYINYFLQGAIRVSMQLNEKPLRAEY